MNLSIQPASEWAWNSKYRVGNEATPADTFDRVATALASVEDDPCAWLAPFRQALENGATPAGRILANAGAEAHKAGVSTINCTVSMKIEDSMEGIGRAVDEALQTLKGGSGIGYDFSTLRPSGAHVHGSGASTTGPLPFMDIFDSACKTVSSAGGRRGAQMATMDVRHPDIIEFITAKREAGRFTRFNCSVMITDSFMDAVENDADWRLIFPLSRKDAAQAGIADVSAADGVVFERYPLPGTADDYFVHADGTVACRIYRTEPASAIWDTIMRSTYDYAEPGFLLIDRINAENNNWWCEEIRATNPCGEQPLPPHGACLLGSVDVTRCVSAPFTAEARFDFDGFADIVRVFSRMLDNVVELSGLPLEAQRVEIERKRRHGMGFTGLGSAMTMLGITYGSDESAAFAADVAKTLARVSWEAGLDLAAEKGAAPILTETVTVTEAMLALRPEMRVDGHKAGDTVPASLLHVRYSRYFQRLVNEGILTEQWRDAAAAQGLRYTHATSIAPTGTISLFRDNVSNGIEPSFTHSYTRNAEVEGRNTKQAMTVESKEWRAYRELHPDADTWPEAWVDAGSIPPQDHIRVQAAAQPYVDSAISKTVNVPQECAFEAFQNLYRLAHRSGLKGATTYRPNPEFRTGVLVRQEELDNTVYTFTTDAGETVSLKGSEELVYCGETTNAANLYHKLKQG